MSYNRNKGDMFVELFLMTNIFVRFLNLAVLTVYRSSTRV